MAKFLTDNYCCTTFYPIHCVSQDLSTKLIVAVGKKVGVLYTIDSSHLKAKISALAANASAVSPSYSLLCSQASTSCDKPTCSSHDLDILHTRLGHTSLSKMQYIADCKPFLANDVFVRHVYWQNFIDCLSIKALLQQKPPSSSFIWIFWVPIGFLV